MAKDQAATPTTLRPRAQNRVAPGGRATPPAAADAPRKAPFDPIKFFREVRQEARKVTWTSWKETWITSVMVGIMVVMTSLFFFLVDAGFSFLMDQMLKLGRIGS
ncbi:MAG TPA: preprotein translocase subunit SecE [Caulobacteraceae bacterium]|jgi:preprotein translocase subunit SecE